MISIVCNLTGVGGVKRMMLPSGRANAKRKKKGFGALLDMAGGRA